MAILKEERYKDSFKQLTLQDNEGFGKNFELSILGRHWLSNNYQRLMLLGNSLFKADESFGLMIEFKTSLVENDKDYGNVEIIIPQFVINPLITQTINSEKTFVTFLSDLYQVNRPNSDFVKPKLLDLIPLNRDLTLENLENEQLNCKVYNDNFEFFININIKNKRVAFCEKDPEYRSRIIEYLVEK